MARFRRFRRFRGRRPLAKASRPVWRELVDFSTTSGAAILGNGATPFSANGSVPLLLRVPLGGNDNFVTTQANNLTPGDQSTSIVLVDDVQMQFFEDECSLVRVMGDMRLHALTCSDLLGGITNRRIEIRACIYKTWEQEGTDNRVGLVNIFNSEAKKARILWTARWLRAINATTDTYTGTPALVSENHMSPAGVSLERGQVAATNSGTEMRRISIRQAIKFKGVERMGLAVSLGPISNTQNQIVTAWFTGWIRGLFKH